MTRFGIFFAPNFFALRDVQAHFMEEETANKKKGHQFAIRHSVTLYGLAVIGLQQCHSMPGSTFVFPLPSDPLSPSRLPKTPFRHLYDSNTAIDTFAE